MSVYISSLCLLLIGFAAACDVSSGDDGCWEDAAANFVQMKAHTNTAVNAGNHKKPEPHEYDKELTSAAAEDGAEALAEGIDAAAEDGAEALAEGIDMEGTVDDEADPTTAEADMSMDNAVGDESEELVEDESEELEEWGEKLEADYEAEEAQQVDGADEADEAVNADEPAKDEENAMNFKDVAIAATAPLVVYEWFKADCSGNGMKKVDGDDPAAQKECNARAACVGWAANYGTKVRRLRAKDCKKAATGKWIFYRKRTSGSPILAK